MKTIATIIAISLSSPAAAQTIPDTGPDFVGRLSDDNARANEERRQDERIERIEIDRQIEQQRAAETERHETLQKGLMESQ